MRRIFVVFSLLLMFKVSTGNELPLPIIPKPQAIEFKSDQFSLGTSQFIVMVAEGGFSLSEQDVQWLQNEITIKWGIKIVPPGSISLKAKTLHLILDSEQHLAPRYVGRSFLPEMADEGYFLDIGADTIRVLAAGRQGLFYGIVSLVQLLRAADDKSLPGVLITDYPAFAWRGVSDDISRGQVSTMDNFKKIIRFLAEHKYNIYMPYLEDLLQMERHPRIGEGRGALSRAEIAELQAYARAWHVEIIPIFQTLGHFENILNLPEYTRYADYPGAASLNVLDGAAGRFLFGMLDEILPWFDSPFFHIGADESWDVGLGATREAAAKFGVARLHADHYNKVYQKVREHGKQVLMYGDIILRHTEILSQIPKDIKIVDWHYSPSDIYPSVKQFADSGFQVLVSPAIHNWLNPFPNLTNAWLNITNLACEGYRNGALGVIISGWGDFGNPNFRELNYLGYAYGAEAAWNPLQVDNATINQRFARQYFGIEDERFTSLLLHLNEIPNQTNFKEIWRQPFYKSDEQVGRLLQRALQLHQHSAAALQLLTQLRPNVTRNASDLDYYALAAKLGIFMADKLSFSRSIELTRQTGDSTRLLPQTSRALEIQCSELIHSLTILEEEYKDLWLRSNRPENLSRILNLFRQLRAYYEEAREAIAAGSLNFPVELTSKFITTKTVSSTDKPTTVYLRRAFTVDNVDSLVSANLQLIANSQATIYLNGAKVGSIIATRSLSLMVENQRVGWWDARPQLVNGQNYLAVEVVGYRAQLPSAANVYLELTYRDGRKVVVGSDRDWEAAAQVKGGWETARDKNVKWNSAVVVDKWQWKISAPLFQRGFASRIEF